MRAKSKTTRFLAVISLVAAAATHADPQDCHAASSEAPVIRVVLTEAGLTPNALVVIGLTDTQVASLIREITESPAGVSALQAHIVLQSAEGAAATSRTTQPSLGQTAPMAASPEPSALSTMRTAARVATRTLGDELLRRLDPAAAQRLRNWRTSTARLPPEMRIVAWTPAQSNQIVRALRQERIAIARGDQVPPLAAAVLADARSRAEVVAARQALNERLPAVTAAIRIVTNR